jgi:hypothetical protein
VLLDLVVVLQLTEDPVVVVQRLPEAAKPVYTAVRLVADTVCSNGGVVSAAVVAVDSIQVADVAGLLHTEAPSVEVVLSLVEAAIAEEGSTVAVVEGSIE